MDYQNKKKKNINFKERKKCAIKSLREVNCFLSNFTKIYAIKKIIKK